MTYVEADNYVRDYRYVGAAPHDIHLHRIKRITAGDSTHVTIAPDDTLCVNNMQDSPEWVRFMCAEACTLCQPARAS